MNEAHAASLLYVHPHPTAARRAATLASSGCEMHMGARMPSDRLRGVLRHEKSNPPHRPESSDCDKRYT